MCGSGAVSCSCSLLIRGPILPAVRQKLHLSPCADSRNRLSARAPRRVIVCRRQLSSKDRSGSLAGGGGGGPVADAAATQLTQAMAGFGGSSGAAGSLSTVPLGADPSQQQFLTTPQQVWGWCARPATQRIATSGAAAVSKAAPSELFFVRNIPLPPDVPVA